jgi:hypothetical protein
MFHDVVGHFREANEPLLAAVFETIERRFARVRHYGTLPTPWA